MAWKLIYSREIDLKKYHKLPLRINKQNETKRNNRKNIFSLCLSLFLFIKHSIFMEVSITSFGVLSHSVALTDLKSIKRMAYDTACTIC